MLLKYLKNNNYLIVYLLIIGIINLCLLVLPLTNVFGYEFSALNALLLSFLSGLFTISFLKSLARENRKFNLENYVSALRWMLFIPFAISIINSIIFGFCSFTDGLMFYFVITFPSVIIGSALGSTIFIFVKKFRVIAFIFLFLLILIISVFEIFFNPQVYLFNPLFAYFPGTIYDEGLSVDLKLILYRIFNLIFFIPILIYFLRRRTKNISLKNKLSFSLSVILISGIFYFFVSPSVGFTTSESSLKSVLANRVESEHFIIHSDKKIEKDELQLIALSQEYYYSELKEYFQEKTKIKITSYIFYNNEQKKKLFGAGAADVAKPWLNSIYVSADTWDSTLKHEIAHCFTADFGTGIFKLASGFNPALIEGVAEAADGYYHENSIHYLASLAFKNGYIINFNSMFSSFNFFGSVSTLSYIYSGSFIKFLVDDFGIKKVKDFYGNGDFNKSFSTDINSVIKNYEIFLDTLTIYAARDKANYYFGRKPLISKVCPRYVASSLSSAWESYYSNNLNYAESVFKDVLSKTDSYSALIGLAKIYEDSDSLSKAIGLLESHLKTFSGTSSEYDLKFRLAELYVKKREIEKAKDIYYFLYTAKPNRRLELVSSVRISLLKNDYIGKYVFGSEFDRYEILKKINKKNYDFASIPLMIDLSKILDEDYQSFLSLFENNFEVKNEISSYAAYKLSEYMLQNFDYIRARKMAGIALRYKGDTNLLKVTEANYQKVDWFFRNADKILKQINFELK